MKMTVSQFKLTVSIIAVAIKIASVNAHAIMLRVLMHVHVIRVVTMDDHVLMKVNIAKVARLDSKKSTLFARI